ncbi:MAG: DMT family transporter [Bacteroidota bacterium]
MKSKIIRSYILALLAMVMWGMSFVWSKITFEYLGPLSTIFIRLTISSALLLVIWLLFYSKNIIKRKDLPLILISGFFSPFCYFIGESFGLVEVSSTIAAVIIATIPVFTPFMAYFFLKEKLSFLNFVGLLISFGGVIVMLLKNDLSFNASIKGVLLLGFAVFSALGYGVAVRKLTLKYHPVTIVTYQNLIGTILFLPFFLYFEIGHLNAVVWNTSLTTSLLCLAIFGSTIAFIFFTGSIRYLGISRANIFSNFIPVFTAVFSFILLSESITINKIVGMALVIAGVVLAQGRKEVDPMELSLQK